MFGSLMFEAWVAAGRPHYAAVARETSRALIPLTEEQVKGFVEGDAVPGSSYQIDAVLASLESYSEFELDGYRPLIMASWDALSNVSTEKRPETTGAGFEGISNVLDHVVEVATYLGAAGVGGIVGNRADAATVRSVKELFTRVRERWLSRKPEQDEALSRDEASDAARAAANALGYPLESLSVRTAEQREEGSWLLILDGRRRGTVEHLRVTVPPGDPGNATIFVIPSLPSRGSAEIPVPLAKAPRRRLRIAFSLKVQDFVARMLTRGMDSWPRAKHPWYCVYCGWKCTERHNQVECRSCGEQRPLVMGSVTMRQCLTCRKFSLASGSYCEWCGTALPAESS
ncbi:hypothetical protein ACFSKW_39555 [Nonomuraea mangrovi]|uniref:RanBP2-type domain-containing protein n=1 Tax=Nonomuraea mangrovi TaxID=2316207 RepID=A0ABW4T880_9ACTN